MKQQSVQMDNISLAAANSDLLNITDHQEIMDIIYRYSYTYDSKNLDAWLSLFLENATWSVYEGNSSVPETVTKSNEERRQMLGQRLKKMSAQGIQSRHYMTNTLLNKTGERKVKGITMFLLIWQYTSEASPRLINTGYYQDEFVKTEHGWMFASREAHIDQASQTTSAAPS
jgi:3-phenylpropionate/cinnamic acid dioxygenase small subunit